MSEAPPKSDQAKALKATLNLPRTDFAMKANLPGNEPARLQVWDKTGLYEQIRARCRAENRQKYILHDGPPYANGQIHLGHALNKCIKDFVVKTKTMAGFDAPFVPGWDCHGLPIEIKVDEQLGGKKLEMSPVEFREACRAYAARFVDLQRSQFKRLGIFGEWDRPYETMNFGYESKILENFYSFYEKGFVYKGLRPVYWCSHDRTALAEAEVEYAQHTSPSVYVRYKLTSPPEKIHPRLRGREVYAIIWTTTPWTLPASLAIAFNPEIQYVALAKGDGPAYIVASALADQVIAACNEPLSAKSKTGNEPGAPSMTAPSSWVGSSGEAQGHLPLPGVEPIAHFPGAHLDRVTFQHPFLDREVLGVLADYVTTDQGTGAVHTAPAHGPDDFATGVKYDLKLTCDVDAQGKLRNGLPEYDGLFVGKANGPIKDLLRKNNALLGAHDLVHQYPHCWRCHHPLIFRATEQWFIAMETPAMSPKEGSHQTTFRQRALDEIKRVVWDPSWGEERISNMISTRPDWCISRQRLWGVPIAVFLCERCHEPLNNEAINKSVVELFSREGADAWYKHPAATLLPAGTICPNCDHTSFRKEMDILDVWFDSGSSWHAVLEADRELAFPADFYFEGGDQHRGWFHSSLLTAVGVRDAAPYKLVATHGWTLDEQGRAFSKSLGNGVDPVQVAERLGAEIIRLWVASVDFREDVVASDALMARVSETYRKLRNTLRFLLSNLYDFTPATDAIGGVGPWTPGAFAQLQPLDQYILARTAELATTVRQAYDDFEFHRAYQAINEFTNADLSALYLDVTKDRLYTFAPNSPERRSAQTAIWRIAKTLTRLLAPILSFTADEVWQHLPQVEGREASVHLALFPDLSEIVPGNTETILRDWDTLLNLRGSVNGQLEVSRMLKEIGKSLDADLTIDFGLTAEDESYRLVKQYEPYLPELFNVSKAEVDSWITTEGNDLPITLYNVKPSSSPRCIRCWRHVSDVGSDARWPEVCLRCAGALEAIGFAPTAAPEPQGEPA